MNWTTYFACMLLISIFIHLPFTYDLVAKQDVIKDLKDEKNNPNGKAYGIQFGLNVILAGLIYFIWRLMCRMCKS